MFKRPTLRKIRKLALGFSLCYLDTLYWTSSPCRIRIGHRYVYDTAQIRIGYASWRIPWCGVSLTPNTVTDTRWHALIGVLSARIWSGYACRWFWFLLWAVHGLNLFLHFTFVSTVIREPHVDQRNEQKPLTPAEFKPRISEQCHKCLYHCYSSTLLS